MIKAENVNYIYQQGMPFERQALYDVNIEIEDGSLVALIGHTGSGKSTLIQHFNRLRAKLLLTVLTLPLRKPI